MYILGRTMVHLCGKDALYALLHKLQVTLHFQVCAFVKKEGRKLSPHSASR